MLRRWGASLLAGLTGAAIGWAGPLAFDPAVVDFGTQRQRLHLVAEVRVTNTTEKELEILRVSSDCSCTAGEPNQRTLAPGHSTVLPIRFETESSQGDVVRRLSVETSAGTAELPVRARIRAFAHWDVTPSPLLLPASPRRRDSAGAVAIKYVGSGKARLLSATTDTPWLFAELRNSSDGSGGSVIVRRSADAPTGRHEAVLTVQTDAPDEPQLNVKVSVPVPSSAKVSPNPIILPTVRAGTAATREIVVSGWEESVAPAGKMPHGSVQVKDRQPNGDYVLIVAVTPTAPGVSAQMLLLFAGSESSSIEIPVMLKALP